MEENYINLNVLEHNNRGGIIWEKSINKIIDFKYKNIKGYLKILKYNKETASVIVSYEDFPDYDIRISRLRACQLSGMLRLHIRDFRYDVGDILKSNKRNLVITNRYKKLRPYDNKYERVYEYVCNDCGFKDGISNQINLISGNGCPVCSNRKIIKGLNDINTTHPEIALYFKYKEDSFRYSYGSTVKIETLCPFCNASDEIKITDLRVNGFNCKKCGDGISYPEKFTRQILDELNLKFVPQYKPNWSKGKKYDFYISSLDIIIEVHGMQHYEKSFSTITGAKTTVQEQENDLLKYNLAIQNGIKPENYIVVDARYSEFDWLKENFIKLLENHFDLSDVDWVKCEKNSTKNIVYEVCNTFNLKTKNTKEIGNIFNIHYATVSRYLKKGSELGWCVYNKNTSEGYANRRRVICTNTGEVFNSMSDASKKYNIKVSNISISCKNENRYAGRDITTKELLKWKYI